LVVRGAHRFFVVAAVALLVLVPLSDATAYVPHRYPFLMNTYTLNSSGLRTTTPLNYLLKPGSIQSTGSLSGFKNTTIVSGVSTLKISTGEYKSLKVDLLYYTTTDAEGASITITTIMMESNAGYSTGIIATLTPKTDDLNLGDLFVIKYPDTLSGALTVLEKAVPVTYVDTDNATLNRLGQYYAAIGTSMKTMQGMIPPGIASLVVSKVQAVAIDPSWSCISAELAFSGAFVGYLAACVTPVVVTVFACIGALFALWSAEAAVNQECG
jgi:hypothetical protein